MVDTFDNRFVFTGQSFAVADIVEAIPMPADLGQFLGVVPTTTSAIVDRLVRRDLVIRNRTEMNRRVVQLELSDEGRRVAAALLAQQDHHCRVMLATLDKADRKAFVRAMEKIAKSIG